MTLPLLSVGAVGVVGTSTHFSALGTKAMIEAYVAGDVATALGWHRRLLPIFTGIFATQGCILVKAGLELQGRGVGGVRSPLVVATEAEIDGLAGLAGGRRTGLTPRPLTERNAAPSALLGVGEEAAVHRQLPGVVQGFARIDQRQ